MPCYRYGDGIDSRTLVVALRVRLLVVAFGVVRISVIFLFEGLFPQSSVPRMMADVLMVVALIVYAIYRMNEIGVNLASLITTSAVLTGVIAFSMQEMLGNLWAESRCRPTHVPDRRLDPHRRDIRGGSVVGRSSGSAGVALRSRPMTVKRS